MSGMKRCAWITASLVALFGLQAPLCAVACLEASHEIGARSAELAGAAPMAEMPCHGAATPEPAPAQSDADPTCTCIAAVVSGAGDASAFAQGLPAALAPTRLLRSVSLGNRPLEHPGRRVERLPPPDILLFNSTLLI